MDMGTAVPATSLREREAYAKRGVDFLDAPVFGSKQESADAALDYGRGQQGHFESEASRGAFGANRSLLWEERKCRGYEAGGKPHRCVEMEALAEGLVVTTKASLDLNAVMEVVKVADFRSPLLVSNGQNI
jgi:3-hydroxyisobutyrate dehydrogenase-like beta-hydroxyacid dehydrogenase